MENKISRQISYDKREDKGWTIWAIAGYMDIKNSSSVEEKGQKVLENTDKMVIDLSGLEYLSSAGLRVFLRFAKRAKKEDKEFALVAANGIVANVLRESKMDMIVKIAESLDEL